MSFENQILQLTIDESRNIATEEHFSPYTYMYGVVSLVHKRRQELVNQYPGKNIKPEIQALYADAHDTLQAKGIGRTGQRIIGQVAARQFRAATGL